MKLEELSITGFGALRDVELRFHPQITVIFGENESGKSTLQRAVRAALYGLDAGGQGRAVDRSDWSRWKPWTPSRYGLALGYQLDDGRRFRVARRLDTREQSVQVLELGGREVTEELRDGRCVSPGWFHLGMREAVFCSTAWLGEDGMRLGSPDAAAQRVDELQEAIERLADTEGGVTAARALRLLREAMERVGTERRMASPLGVATARLRELDAALSLGRLRLETVAREQERLRELEARARTAEGRRLDAERAWLTGRLAELRHRLEQLQQCEEEAAEHAAALAETRAFAAFRTDDEERVIALGAEVNQLTLAAAEARKRLEASASSVEAVRRRRAEIAAGLQALGPETGRGPDEPLCRQLHAELAAAAAGWARLDTAALIEERRAALRREIAATGFGDLRPEAVEALAPLLGGADGPRLRWWTAPAVAVSSALLAFGIVLSLGHRPMAAAGTLIASLGLGAALTVILVRTLRDRHARRRSRLAEMRRAGLPPGELERVADRLPSLRALQAALLREEALGDRRRDDAEALEHEARAVYARCAGAAESAGMAVPRALSGAATVEAYLDGALQLLAGIDAAVAAQRRRRELVAEDRQLAMTEVALDQVKAEVGRTQGDLDDAMRRLLGVLAGAGLHAVATPVAAVAAFREACAARRRHDEALRARDAVQRRIAALGADATALQRSCEHYAAQLRARGGEPATAPPTLALEAESLRTLEMAAEHAARDASTALAEAKALRARLQALLDGVPDVADLEDERSACMAARTRGLRQLAALQRASELIEAATRGAHRRLAPALAESMEARLELLTSSRYQRVNVDSDHFAVSLLAADRPDYVPLETCSQGTRDQVSLLLRLALSEVLGSGGESSPVLLDEPLASSDHIRRRLMLEFLQKLSSQQQVVITTNDPGLCLQMQEVAGEACAVVVLGDEPTLETTGRLQQLQRSPAMRTRPSSSDTSSVKSGIRAAGTAPSRSSLES